MPCPDDLTLDLWLADALPAAESARLTTHLTDCPSCQAAVEASRRADQALSAALALDAEELAYLEGLNLARQWRTAPQPAAWWHWLLFLGTLVSFAAWSVAGPLARPALDLMVRTGLGVVLARGLLETLARLVEAVLVLAASPLLVYSLPLLAILGLILLAWPRPTRMAPATA